MRAPLAGDGRPETGAAGTVHPGRARRQRSSSATPRRSGCRGMCTTRTWRRCTSATRSMNGTRRFPEPFHGVVSYIGDMLDPATRTTPGSHRHAEPGRAAQEGSVRRRRDSRQDDARRARRADDGRALRRAEFSVRLRAGRSRQVRAAPREARRPAGRRAPRFSTASRPANPSSRRAACSCSSRTPISSNAMINRLVSFALSQRFIVIVAMLCSGGLGRRVVPEPADRRLPGSVAAAGADRDAVAGACGRGSRAPHHHPARGRDERHPEARRAALDLALRPVVGHDELPVRHRSVLCARSRRSSGFPTRRCRPA